MVFCDPTYGLLVVAAKHIYGSFAPTGLFTSSYNVLALVVIAVLTVLVTLLFASVSAMITWLTEVDESSSMKLSRSVHESCERMVFNRRSQFDVDLTRVLQDGSDARFMDDGIDFNQAQARELREFDPGGNYIELEEARVEPDIGSDGGKRSRWGSLREFVRPARKIDDTSRNASDADAAQVGTGNDDLDMESERQLQLDPGAISATLCFSVLVYDVLGFIVCFMWGVVTIRLYSVLFGRIAGVHDAWYAFSCMLYAACVVVALSKFIFSFFPSEKELQLHYRILEDVVA